MLESLDYLLSELLNLWSACTSSSGSSMKSRLLPRQLQRVALNAADKPLTVVVNLNERLLASRARFDVILHASRLTDHGELARQT
jgi:hypothetical protein